MAKNPYPMPNEAAWKVLCAAWGYMRDEQRDMLATLADWFAVTEQKPAVKTPEKKPE